MDAPAAGMRQWLNPLVLGLQKMELELTCPVCLKLLGMPMLLPCYHICCRSCTAATAGDGTCPICKEPFCSLDSRPAAHIEAVVNIYRSLGSTISRIMKQHGSQVKMPGTKDPSGESCPNPGNQGSVQEIEDELMCDVAGSQTMNKQLCRSPSREMTDAKFSGDGKTCDFGVDRRNTMEMAGVTSVLEQKGPTRSPSSDNQLDLEHDNNRVACTLPVQRSAKREINRVDYVEPKRLRYTYDSNEISAHDSKVMRTCSPNARECGFCHSTDITEGSGPMLHYLDGEPVSNEALQPEVLHVHEKCIEWAPQVYFNGDTAMNLDNELARASKIKCNICGLKGAALGCYVRSCRRSFHVPCVYSVPNCRWDTEKFLMLCPSHSSHKLPCDRKELKTKSKAKHHSSTSSMSIEDACSPAAAEREELWAAAHPCTKKWLLCGSALSNTDKSILNDFEYQTGVAVAPGWEADVTHVIAATDEHGACSRTLKVLMGILSGKWILSVDWLMACMVAGEPVPEEPYEITHDLHGTFDGPRTGRLRAMQKAPSLYSGLSFYFSGNFMPNYRRHLESLILAAGGSISSMSDLSPTTLVVYSTDLPQGSDQNSLNEVIKKRKSSAEELAAATGSRVVPHTWLLDSIAACTVQMP